VAAVAAVDQQDLHVAGQATPCVPSRSRTACPCQYPARGGHRGIGSPL
jgi:hypothetical protein